MKFLQQPELDVWHLINGGCRAKRKETNFCKLVVGDATTLVVLVDTTTTLMNTATTVVVSTISRRLFGPSNHRPPPSLVTCCRPPIDGRDGSETELIGRKGGNLDRAVNHRARD